MRCYQHASLDVVATCGQCGRGLCSGCSSKYNLPLCANCAHSMIASEKSDITRSFIASIVLACAALVLTSGAPAAGRIFLMYSFAGIPWGWRVLTRITPSVFLVMPLIGWLFYFSIKLTLATWVGMVALPIFVFKRVNRWRELKALQGTAIGG
ncbi:MAG TPA: hypothetical protein VFR81_04945 [Longimicrobium sp.]|nr:hypothetical protein [Longimicrobium sp.]